ncbi:MAG: hypothetical protein ACYCOR_10695 [Acidobacteriaceae bacterium]
MNQTQGAAAQSDAVEEALRLLVDLRQELMPLLVRWDKPLEVDAHLLIGRIDDVRRKLGEVREAGKHRDQGQEGGGVTQEGKECPACRGTGDPWAVPGTGVIVYRCSSCG